MKEETLSQYYKRMAKQADSDGRYCRGLAKKQKVASNRSAFNRIADAHFKDAEAHKERAEKEKMREDRRKKFG